MSKKNTLTVDGVIYVRQDSQSPAQQFEGLDYVITRSRDAGVHAGYLQTREGKEVVLLQARRLWRWAGAASLSQLAMEGVQDPTNCKFPCEVTFITLTDVIELLPVTEKARQSIKEVSIWKM